MSKVNEADVRAEVREWLAANWDPEMSLVEWRSKLADSGWGMPQWPREWYGRDLPHALVRAVYGSALYAQLLVIDKENGGKADAMNAGINFSRAPLTQSQ